MIKIKGLDRVQDKIKSLYNNIEQTKPMLGSIGNMIKNEIELNFEREQSSDGTKWQDTKDSKRSKGDKVLHDTTRLANSFSIIVSSDSVEVGTNLPYAPIHHFGGKAGPGKKVTLPARPFLPIDDKGLLDDKLRQQIVQYIKGNVG